MVAKFASWFFGLPAIWRTLLSVGFGGAFGAALMQFLSQYAIYLYCLRYGARVAVEGSPSLSIAVSVLSFVTLSISIAVVPLLTAFLTLLAKLIESIFRVEIGMVGAIVINLAFAAALLAVVLFVIYGDQEFLTTPPLHPTLLVVSGIAIIVLLASIQKLTIALVVLIFISSLVALGYMLFAPGPYEEFLRYIRHGGGGKVILEVERDKAQSQKAAPLVLEGGLFLITMDSAMIYDGAEFVEVPRNRIISMRYKPGATASMPPRL